MKKVFITLVITPIITLLFSINILAETVYTEGALNYVIRDGVVVITKYFGNDQEVVVPSNINNIPVIEIASGAFVDTNAKNIIIPDTVVNIDAGAIPDDVKYDVVDEASLIDKNDNNIEQDTQYEQKGNDSQDVIEQVDVNEQTEEIETVVIDENEVVESGDVSIEEQENDSVSTDTKEKQTNTSKSIDIVYVIIGFVVAVVVVIIINRKKNARS